MQVSIIIPTYNRSKMLKEAIESVQRQDWPEKEIIVVDDGSTDDTAEVISQTIRGGLGLEPGHQPRAGGQTIRGGLGLEPGHQPRAGGQTIRGGLGLEPGHQTPAVGLAVDYIRTENRGVSHARNVGIKRARGELIAFLDSDDIWLPGKLRHQIEYFEKNPDIHICQTEEIWIRNGRRVNPKLIHKKYSGWIFEECIPRCIVSPSAVMIKKSVFDDIGLFDEKMPACEDYDLWLRASLKYRIITLPEPLIIKRGGHPDQLSRQWGLDIWRIYALEKALAAGVGCPRLEDIIKNDILRRKKIVAEGARKRGNTT